MSIQTAIGMATKAFDEAEREFLIAKRTQLLVEAFMKSGSARVMLDGGQVVEITVSYTGHKQQDEWSIYYSCRDWAERSLRKAPR